MRIMLSAQKLSEHVERHERDDEGFEQRLKTPPKGLGFYK